MYEGGREKCQNGSQRNLWEDDDWIDPAQDRNRQEQVAAFCGHAKELSGFVKYEEFRGKLRNYQLLKQDTSA